MSGTPTSSSRSWTKARSRRAGASPPTRAGPPTSTASGCINCSLDALVNAAAKLPRIAIEAPESDSVIGRTTESQMIIGIYWGYVAMLEGLAERIKRELGRPVAVVGTGGLATLFDKHTKVFDAIEPD